MDFIQNLQKISIPLLHERSQLDSVRESESTPHYWKYINLCSNTINALIENVLSLKRDLVSLSTPKLGGIDFYPFKIYQFPEIFRTTSIDSYNDWRKVRVRAGCVLTDYIDPLSSSLVIGTDGIRYTDDQFYPNETGSLDILVPENTSQYWFWVEQSSSNYYLRDGADPTVTSSYNPSAWTTFPTPDSTHWPVGYVDSLLGAGSHQLYVRQFARGDILSAGAGEVVSDVKQLKIKEVGDDWLRCREFFSIPGETQDDEVTVQEQNEDVYVAKQPKHRCSIGSESQYDIISGVDINHEYSYADAYDGNYDPNAWAAPGYPGTQSGSVGLGINNTIRTDHVGVQAGVPKALVDEQQQITPVWMLDDIIYAMSVVHSNVFIWVAGEGGDVPQELYWIEIGGSRQWMEIYPEGA